MLLVAAAVPLLIALWWARAPVSEGRVERFRRTYALELTPQRRQQVVTHLTFTRRRRTAGAACGYLAGLVPGPPEQRIALSFLAVAAGWLAGAVVAEARSPLPGGAPPPWMRRVPAVLVVVTVAVTGILLIIGREPAVAAWGAGALACAGLIVLAQRFIARRDPDAEIGPVFARHSAGAIAGVGTALAVACLAAQAGVVRDQFFDATGDAWGLTRVLWSLGGLSVGWLVANAVRRGVSPRAVSWPVVALCVGTAGIFGYAWQHDRPPYPATALQVSAAIRLTDDTRFTDDARAVGVSGLEPLQQEDAQQFVGRIDLRPPAGAPADGSFHLVVIDKRQDRVASALFGPDGGGWNGFYDDLPHRYPWLSAMAPTRTGGGFVDAGMSVTVSAGSAGSLPFVGSFTDSPGMTSADLMVALIFTGPDSQTYWARPVPVSG